MALVVYVVVRVVITYCNAGYKPEVGKQAAPAAPKPAGAKSSGAKSSGAQASATANAAESDGPDRSNAEPVSENGNSEAESV